MRGPILELNVSPLRFCDDTHNSYTTTVGNSLSDGTARNLEIVSWCLTFLLSDHGKC